MRFKDKVAIISGGAVGLGRAISLGFGQEGAVVYICDIDLEKATHTAGEIPPLGGQAIPLKVDVSLRQEIENVVDEVIKRGKKIDILVNNVGWTDTLPFMETDEKRWRRVIDLNLICTMNFCHVVLPHMINRKYGRIVNIASIAGRQPRPLAVAYGAAKAGVISITKSLAVIAAPHNIRVNCVAPGDMDTPMLKELSPTGDCGSSTVSCLGCSILRRRANIGHRRRKQYALNCNNFNILGLDTETLLS
jgi:NAD(P)-dependent dehydrogenase (short-subunit alcohol dehydrogenase family)